MAGVIVVAVVMGAFSSTVKNGMPALPIQENQTIFTSEHSPL
jgi:hypothetical protein